MKYLHGIRNLKKQPSIKHKNGRWNMTVWIDTRDFSEKIREKSIELSDLAKKEKIRLCQNAQEILHQDESCVFLVGHNAGWENSGMLRDLLSLGNRIKGRYIILNCCGLSDDEIQTLNTIHLNRIAQLVQNNGAVGVFGHPRLIPVSGICQIFIAMIEIGHRNPNMSPGAAMDEAIARVLKS